MTQRYGPTGRDRRQAGPQRTKKQVLTVKDKWGWFKTQESGWIFNCLFFLLKIKSLASARVNSFCLSYFSKWSRGTPKGTKLPMTCKCLSSTQSLPARVFLPLLELLPQWHQLFSRHIKAHGQQEAYFPRKAQALSRNLMQCSVKMSAR